MASKKALAQSRPTSGNNSIEDFQLCFDPLPKAHQSQSGHLALCLPW